MLYFGNTVANVRIVRNVGVISIFAKYGITMRDVEYGLLKYSTMRKHNDTTIVPTIDDSSSTVDD